MHRGLQTLIHCSSSWCHHIARPTTSLILLLLLLLLRLLLLLLLR